jgi:glutamate-1-semialdehyde aminotransferase
MVHIDSVENKSLNLQCGDKRLRSLIPAIALPLALTNRGVLLPPGLDEQWLISVMHNDNDAMRYAAVFDEFVQELTG